MIKAFSAKQRTDALTSMADKESSFDVLIIGGGITGAGIAWDAASRGLKVGLLEMNDFSWGTSSRSTKLVHGGLRYLKQGEIKLVREVGRERALLYKKAPHIVIPESMLLPIYKGGTYGYWASSIGLYIYDWLAGVKRGERRRMHKKEATKRLEPLFKDDGLKGSGDYYEYRTDDARLTIEIIKSAHKLGASIVNYAKVERFIYAESGKVIGVEVRDQLTGKVMNMYAKKIVNAAGPWVDKVRTLDGSKQGKHLLLTKGVHLVVARDRLPVSQAAYFDVSDGRMIFVIPRGKITYIGTTDTVYNDVIEKPQTTREDRDYLLQAVNAMFPSVRLTAEDVQSSWAGLRPLIHEEGKSPSEISRKDEIFIAKSGLISIAGGKLTGFRKMAEKVIDLVAKQLLQETGRSIPACRTHLEAISGGMSAEHLSYELFCENWIREGERRGISREAAKSLLDIYGCNVTSIYDLFDQRSTSNPEGTSENERYAQLLAAQITYSVTHEMTVTALDFVVRRTGWIYFEIDKVREEIGIIVRYMGER